MTGFLKRDLAGADASASDELDAVFPLGFRPRLQLEILCVLEIAGQHLRREGERQPPRLSPSTTLKATLRCSPSLMKQWQARDRERQMPNKKRGAALRPFLLSPEICSKPLFLGR